jgi:hypothetical protein
MLEIIERRKKGQSTPRTKSKPRDLWKWVKRFPIFMGPNVKMANNGTFSEQIGNKTGEKRMETEPKGTKWVIWRGKNPSGGSEMRFPIGPKLVWKKQTVPRMRSGVFEMRNGAGKSDDERSQKTRCDSFGPSESGVWNANGKSPHIHFMRAV